MKCVNINLIKRASKIKIKYQIDILLISQSILTFSFGKNWYIKTLRTLQDIKSNFFYRAEHKT